MHVLEGFHRDTINRIPFSIVQITVHFSGITPDASTETLPSAEGRDYEMALEEDWGLRAVAALGEPYPQPRNALSFSRRVTEEAEGEVVLLLACLCRGLGTTYVVRVPEILSRWEGGEGGDQDSS